MGIGAAAKSERSAPASTETAAPSLGCAGTAWWRLSGGVTQHRGTRERCTRDHDFGTQVGGNQPEPAHGDYEAGGHHPGQDSVQRVRLSNHPF
jgi:hypothetical protein